MSKYVWMLGFLVLGLSAQAATRLLYLYGDVSEDGNIPSGLEKPFHQMRLSDTGPLGLSGFKTALEQVGFQAEEAYDAEVTLTEAFLADYRVLMLGSNQRRFTSSEATALRSWVEAGGGVVAWSDSAFGGHHRKVGIANTLGRESDNDLMSQFGMHFLTDNGGGNYLITSFEEDHYLNDFNKEGGVQFRGEGVSPVRIRAPAKMLARLQDGGLGGALKVNKVDGVFNPETDAALAIAEVGKGRVIGFFDRNCFWNAGAGSRLSQVDNREMVQRMAIWLAGLEKTVAIPERADRKKSDAGNRATLELKVVDRQELQADLTAIVAGDVMPEFKWSLVKGSGKISFENGNALTQTVRIFFSKPGTYTIKLNADFGDARADRTINITVTQ